MSITRQEAFQHRALLYEGERDFVTRLLPFVREGIERGDAVMVATSGRKCDRLACELDGASGEVEFVDMVAVGRNPGRIISAWSKWAEANRSRALRGVGEPIWAGRSAAELIECEHHESLINQAFDAETPFELVCPYDVESLSTEAVATARRTHPVVSDAAGDSPSPAYVPPDRAASPFSGDLAPAPGNAATVDFDGGGGLAGVRSFAFESARQAGVAEERARDLALAVNELATNSVRHGGGAGTLRTWIEPGAVVCEITDSGRIEGPLTGRIAPTPEALDGRGLWIVNQVCDLVQIRSQPGGSLVRIRVDTAAERPPRPS